MSTEIDFNPTIKIETPHQYLQKSIINGLEDSRKQTGKCHSMKLICLSSFIKRQPIRNVHISNAPLIKQYKHLSDDNLWINFETISINNIFNEFLNHMDVFFKDTQVD